MYEIDWSLIFKLCWIISPISIILLWAYHSWENARAAAAQKEKKKKECAEQARLALSELTTMPWEKLLGLKWNHNYRMGNPFGSCDMSKDGSYTYSGCKEELEAAGLDDPCVVCWLNIVDREVRQRLHKLRMGEQFSDILKIAKEYNLEVAWNALLDSPEGLHLLRTEHDSQNPTYRRAAHKALYG
jgi:hypothetical protein